MTGCEIVVVLTLLYRDGLPTAIKATPVVPRKCRAHVRFRAAPPVRLLFCPVIPR